MKKQHVTANVGNKVDEGHPSMHPGVAAVPSSPGQWGPAGTITGGSEGSWGQPGSGTVGSSHGSKLHHPQDANRGDEPVPVGQLTP